MKSRAIATVLAAALVGCSGTQETRGTLAELEAVPADTEEIYLEDSLERAAQSYRAYLTETPTGALTPEAMRRLADLQLEREYGILGGAESASLRELPAEDVASLDPHRTVSVAALFDDADGGGKAAPTGGESDEDFEARATDLSGSLATAAADAIVMPEGVEETVPLGPLEAIATYQQILDTYPNYERNDQVLYQMSRAYDELGRPDEAIEVMARLVRDFPYSKYVDEVRFRRGEYFFVRKRYLDAEDEYGAITRIGETSRYYELARYKLGWTFYKQELYEEALGQFIAMLDYRLSTGYDFGSDYFSAVDEQPDGDVVDERQGEGDAHRVADTFRVISLSFSNLGGAEIVSDYFRRNGRRSYADKIYANLGEFFFAKLRYDDAASVYRSFIDENPLHTASPHFGMRIIDIYDAGAFPRLVVEAKKRFATDYAIDSTYWAHNDIGEAEEVVGFLKQNLTDLANHYHALFQEETLAAERPANFDEATRWYRQFLDSFPEGNETPGINYQLADLLLENEDFVAAAQEYERTAYDYAPHARSSSAGYAAVFAYREELKVATGARRADVREAAVLTSLRFANGFQRHEQAPVVLGAAADDLYDMQDYHRAIDSATKLIERYPASDPALRLSAWAVIAHSSIDIAAYRDAELAYTEVLGLTPQDDDNRQAVVDGLAAAIYKQGEEAGQVEDYRAAADHFLRIRDVAPTSKIREAAEYDAAAALMKLEIWDEAAAVLESFRDSFPEHELNRDATRQLAFVYREDGQLDRSAAEHVRMADEADDAEFARNALLVAGELYDEIGDSAKTIGVFSRYVESYPRPLDVALETRNRLAELYRDAADYVSYHEELASIVSIDADAGTERTDRSRYLAANAALVLAELTFERFAQLELRQPFEQSLADKQQRMDDALAAFENLVDYRVPQVTAAATFYIAEIYFEFSASLVASERPAGLSEAERVDYELVIEEEAYPFEERAIEVHEQNVELLTSAGVYNAWVERSLEKLAVLMPGRYAKSELSAGYVGSVDHYAYRMPIAPLLAPADGESPRQTSESVESGAAPDPVARSADFEGQESMP